MRIWDIQPRYLCRVHLLGEHREIHALWTILTEDKKGYRHHPETKRWVGKTRALFSRHEELVIEMKKRGYTHRSPLDTNKASGDSKQQVFLHTHEEQIQLLKHKKCECFILE